ncbi:hypothetical protein KCU73_g10644, partial [Aureobasidium melanogenum]
MIQVTFQIEAVSSLCQFFHRVYASCVSAGATSEEASDRFLWYLNGVVSVGESLQQAPGLQGTLSETVPPTLREIMLRLQQASGDEEKAVDEQLKILVASRRERKQREQPANEGAKKPVDLADFIVIDDDDENDKSAKTKKEKAKKEKEKEKEKAARGPNKCPFEKATVAKVTPSDHDSTWNMVAAFANLSAAINTLIKGGRQVNFNEVIASRSTIGRIALHD